MLILGIESSCDETAMALVRDGRLVLGSLIASQLDLHRPYGGVVPEIAARAHLSALRPLFERLMRRTKTNLRDIDGVAVTQGPGLIGALLVGVHFAIGIGEALGKPVIPINHIHAHIHGALLSLPLEQSWSEYFPCLSLVVSGGHTNLYYSRSPSEFQLIGYSIDDACGESFDKVAKMLGLSYPGGPLIEAHALKGDNKKFPMPRMMEKKVPLRFSYSGLKTHVANLIHQYGSSLKDQDRYDISAAFQHEALHQIIRKTTIALQHFKDAKSVVVAGGVAANQYFRKLMKGDVQSVYKNLKIVFPNIEFCSDNAAMIAALGFYEQEKYTGSSTQNLEPFSRYPFKKFLYSIPQESDS